MIGKTNVPWKISRLPTGYQEVEYLESSGTQYIDTGFTMTSTEVERTEFDIEFMALASTHNPSNLFGFTNTSTAIYGLPVYRPNATRLTFVFSSANIYADDATAGVKYSAIVNDANHKLYLNGTDYGAFSTQSYKAINTTMYLFAAYDIYGYFTDPASARVYSFVIKNNTTSEILMNLVPCYRTSDNVAGMIDLVDNTFYTNAGTGTFIVGANV